MTIELLEKLHKSGYQMPDTQIIFRRGKPIEFINVPSTHEVMYWLFTQGVHVVVSPEKKEAGEKQEWGTSIYTLDEHGIWNFWGGSTDEGADMEHSKIEGIKSALFILENTVLK